MKNLSNQIVVEKQYQTANNLNIRINIHDKYSTNKTGFGHWIYSHYEIPSNSVVLELGCGTADMWKSKRSLLKSNTKLILSDLSEGMLDVAKQNIGEKENVFYKRIDIENIPYEDAQFHCVIANMMLYHVPEIQKGLSEVRRVLHDDGVFYCATYGENGIILFLTKILSEFGLKDTTNKNFTLQNGDSILHQYFSSVERYDYIDSLAVTNIEDLLDYIFSFEYGRNHKN